MVTSISESVTDSLNKFGVPMSGLGTPDRGGILQPKYMYRYRVRVLNFGLPGQNGVDITQQVMSCSRPTLQYAVVDVNAYNSIAYFAGRHSWSTLTLKLRDDVTNAATSLVGAQMQKQLDQLEQTGWAPGNDYKFQMFLEIMDGGNTTVLESWYIEGCWLSEVNYGDMDYSQSEIMTITLTVRPDNCTQTGGLMPTQSGGLQDATNGNALAS